MSDIRTKRARKIKYDGFSEEFVNDFHTKWNITRRLVRMELRKYEKLYRNNKDFREYVERCMRNNDRKLKDVLNNKLVQSVGDMYERESHEKSS